MKRNVLPTSFIIFLMSASSVAAFRAAARVSTTFAGSFAGPTMPTSAEKDGTLKP